MNGFIFKIFCISQYYSRILFLIDIPLKKKIEVVQEKITYLFIDYILFCKKLYNLILNFLSFVF